MPFFYSFLYEIFAIVIAFLLLIHLYHRKVFSYWKNRRVPYLEPTWVFGSVKNEVLRRNTWHAFGERCYNMFKSRGYGGFFVFTRPIFVVCDPNLIEKILVTDFEHFHDRHVFKEVSGLMKSLMFLSGEKWRQMRVKLNAGFSCVKVKSMFDQNLRCVDQILLEVVGGERKGEAVDADFMAFNFAADSIASCGFGVQLMSDSEEGKRFRKMLNIANTSLLHYISIMISFYYPKVTKLFKLNLIFGEVNSYFYHLTENTIQFRKQNEINRNDFLQMMLTLQEQERKISNGSDTTLATGNVDSDQLRTRSEMLSNERIFTDDSISSTLLNLLIAGIHPTVVTISFAMFEIAKNPSVQKRLQDDIDSAIEKHKGWKCEALRDMTYLDQVVQETFRLYSYSTMVIRTVTKPYRVLDTDVILEEGIVVQIPIAAIHKDPQHYPSPEEFIPERFANRNYKPSPSFMPFGDGPRICISIKFAIMMVKVCLARVMSKYSVDVDEKMQLPLKFDSKSFFPKSVGGIWLKFNKRHSI